MFDLTTVAAIVGGLILLVVGGDFLVRGSVAVATRLGVSPLLIGLTLVGFGTSTPELVTSVQAALVDSPGIAIGNIVGSNIVNILLILGVAAAIWPIPVSRSALYRDGVIVVLTAAWFVLLGLTIGLTILTGILSLIVLAAYLTYAYRQERTSAPQHSAALDRAIALEQLDPATDPARPQPSLIKGLGLALVGLIAIVFGGRFLVAGAVDAANSLGISETVIGLTVVAIGTSMPELVTSVTAAIRREPALALGNVLGSNIYNVLFIGGVTAVIAPTQVPDEIVKFDNWVMLGISVALLILARRGIVSRVGGASLLVAYIAYTAFLVLTA